MQYGSPIHQEKLNEAIRELHKCRGLTPYGECPKCKRVGWAAWWPKCPTCDVNVVVDSIMRRAHSCVIHTSKEYDELLMTVSEWGYCVETPKDFNFAK